MATLISERIYGLTKGAQAFLLARRFICYSRRMWVICPDSDYAEQLADQTAQIGSGVFGLKIPTYVFSVCETSLYSPVLPSASVRIKRMAGLAAMHPSAPPSMILTTLPACSQATLPISIFEAHSLTLEAGQLTEGREQIIEKLTSAGYIRTEPCEDPCTFTVRGEIVDVFPPNLDFPLRIELFGDAIERMRPYDPTTQRVLKSVDVKTIQIPPAREVLINPGTRPRIQSAMKEHCDSVGIPRQKRDPILESIRAGAYPDHCEAWAPFAYEHAATAWDYMESSSDLVWIDQDGCKKYLDEFIAEQVELEKPSLLEGLVLPEVKRLFQSQPPSGDRFAGSLFIDRVNVSELGGSTGSLVKTFDHQTGRGNSFDLWTKQINAWLETNQKVWVFASTQSQAERLAFLFSEHKIRSVLEGEPQPNTVKIARAALAEGFCWPDEKIVLVADHEILGIKKTLAPSEHRHTGWSGLQSLNELSIGDAVVHIQHGVGLYRGLVRLDLAGGNSDYLQLEYANQDKLYLPIYRLDLVQKFSGAGAEPKLDRLGSKNFEKTKEKVRNAVRQLAFDLVQLYAKRQLALAEPFDLPETVFQEFAAKFPFTETQDQLTAIDDTVRDLTKGKVMDRLICGDVGFGKTEVAMRAAFLAILSGKQVAILVPTTILSLQHEQTFRARFKDYPVQIAALSRMSTPKSQKQVIENITNGKVDLVIGTHRLLSRDIAFKNLGLLIVDEEHRFGVEHKEKLKNLKLNAHVLTLTATPIPRTLSMCLSGVRDISLITTPPQDRLPIRTFVSKREDSLIQKAITTELARGGQVFFLHNRVQSIYAVAHAVNTLVPHARVAVAHGQMNEHELESTMLGFYQRHTDVLVCTTIIESGLDIPSANTIVIDEADHFGLSQLYQIRGRVGRSDVRAYAYLLVHSLQGLTDEAKQRLEVIQKFIELGSGFSIASHDLEIRGGGNLLGPQQAGHISAVGLDLYTELLEETMNELRGVKTSQVSTQHREPEIKTPFPAFLDESYIPDIHQRLSFYRKLASSITHSEIESIEEELQERYGPLPIESLNLLWVIRLKQALVAIGADALTVGDGKVSIQFNKESRIDPVRAVALASKNPGVYHISPESKFVFKTPTQTLKDVYFQVEKTLQLLSKPFEFGSSRC